MLPNNGHDRDLNLAAWNLLAAVHGQDAYYDTEGFCAGASSLIAEEEAALAAAIGTDLTGKRILHLQCHLGFDAITFARRGAVVTGIDFSSVALEKAEQIATRCGVRVEWIEADAVAMPASLHGVFDLVWATMGVLCWIEDHSGWMRSVAGALAPGGKLVLMDGIPRRSLVHSIVRFVTHPSNPRRRVISRGWDYATPLRTGEQVQFYHSLRAIRVAAERAGIRVELFEEHAAVSTDLRTGNARGADGLYRRRDGKPTLFTLVASKPAA